MQVGVGVGVVTLDVVVASSIHNEVCVGSGVRVSLHVDDLVGPAGSHCGGTYETKR